MVTVCKMAGATIEDYFQLGWFHLILFIIGNSCTLGSIGNMAFQVFGAIKPTAILCNSIPYTESEQLCALVRNDSCSNLSMVTNFESIVTEWNLICDRRSIAYLCTSLQMVGVLMGAPFFGQLSDTFGRKWVLVSDTLLLIVFGSLSSLSPNWKIFMIFRFVIGFFAGGGMTVWFVFYTEMIPTKHRTWMSSVLGAPFGYLLVAGVAYLCGQWRTLSGAINCSLIPGLIAIIFLLPESARWLTQKGKLEKAQAALEHISRLNKRKINKSDLRAVLAKKAVDATTSGRGTKHSFWHLFYTWQLFRYTLVLALAWFTISSVSYGILFGAGKLSGSTYLNMTYYGLLKGFMGCLVALSDVFLRKCGRKVIHSIGVLTMVSCTGIILITSLFSGSGSVMQGSITKYLSLIAAGMTTPVWLIMYLMTAELYPTPIRNLANSFCSACARVGAVLAPQFLYLGEYWGATPYLLYTALLLLDFTAFLLVVPETKGKPLPERIPSAEKIVLN